MEVVSWSGTITLRHRCPFSFAGVGGNLATYTPSKVDLAHDGFELGVTARATISSLPSPQSPTLPSSLKKDQKTTISNGGGLGNEQQHNNQLDDKNGGPVDYRKNLQDPQAANNAWGQETPADMLY
uniref:Uncharacterized protein n=1 Tax=Trichogramma kaykai TaxID=54128 RepID=A0ABD2W532_9HYME